MIQSHLFFILMLLIMFQGSFCQRRIKDGEEVASDKRYMVYLLRADSEPIQYQGWLCGGAILSKDYVLTSAACVQDVQRLYVIAGYKHYVAADKLKDDECIKQKRKKVVLICVPRMYNLNYNKTEVWARNDIAVIKVETSFDFNDSSYEKVCSYKPQAIKFNMEANFPKPEDDVIALGWGHSDKFRINSELVDMNQPTLLYAATSVLDPTYCIEYFRRNPALVDLIKWSMICTLMRGNLNDKGKLIVKSKPAASGCIPDSLVLRGAVEPRCGDEARAAAKALGQAIDEPQLYDHDADKALTNNTTLRTDYIKPIERKYPYPKNNITYTTAVWITTVKTTVKTTLKRTPKTTPKTTIKTTTRAPTTTTTKTTKRAPTTTTTKTTKRAPTTTTTKTTKNTAKPTSATRPTTTTKTTKNTAKPTSATRPTTTTKNTAKPTTAKLPTTTTKNTAKPTTAKLPTTTTTKTTKNTAKPTTAKLPTTTTKTTSNTAKQTSAKLSTTTTKTPAKLPTTTTRNNAKPTTAKLSTTTTKNTAKPTSATRPTTTTITTTKTTKNTAKPTTANLPTTTRNNAKPTTAKLPTTTTIKTNTTRNNAIPTPATRPITTTIKTNSTTNNAKPTPATLPTTTTIKTNTTRNNAIPTPATRRTTATIKTNTTRNNAIPTPATRPTTTTTKTNTTRNNAIPTPATRLITTTTKTNTTRNNAIPTPATRPTTTTTFAPTNATTHATSNAPTNKEGDADLNDGGFLTGEETPGICQNDHGGPLIAWRGGKEIIVGVATLFRLDSNQNCIGPYLFTKTSNNAVFINCIINQEKMWKFCKNPNKMGFKIIRRRMSWAGHRNA